MEEQTSKLTMKGQQSSKM